MYICRYFSLLLHDKFNESFRRTNIRRAMKCLKTEALSRDRCYDYLNIFAKNFGEKIDVFDSKQS
jgi:hypothetical protein